MSYSAPEQRSVRLDLFANAGVGDFANPAVSATPFQSFGATVADAVQDNFNGSMAHADGEISQTSTLTSGHISSISSMRWSAGFESTYPQAAEARASAHSDGHITFLLAEYSRYTLLANMSASVSAQVTEIPAGNSASYANAGIGLTNTFTNQSYGSLSLEAHAGFGSGGDTPSKSTSSVGYLPAGRYALNHGLSGGAFVGNYAHADVAGEAESRVSLVVEPMGTRLVAFEVNQAVQDWNQSVPLIAGKRTYVRAHVEPISAASVPVMNPRLRAYVNGLGGKELAGSPLLPLPRSAQVALPGAATDARRKDWAGSVNFELPSAWLQGNVRLVMEMDGLVSGNASLERVASFATSPQLPLRFVRTSITREGLLVSPRPTRVAILQEVARLAEMYPLAASAVHISYDSLDMSLSPTSSADQFLERFNLLRKRDGSQAIRIAAVSGQMSSQYSGMVDRIPGDLAVVRVDHQGTLAHEVGHALGEFHPVNFALFGSWVPPQPDNAYPAGTVFVKGPACDGFVLSAPQSQASDFPFWDGNFADIGPVTNDPALRIYGIANSSTPGSETAISPEDVVDLMMGSYCGNIRNWISSFTYGRLRNAMLGRFPAAPRQAVPAALETSPYLAIRGLVDFNDNSVSLLPFLPLAAADPAPSGSSHLLEVYCNSGSGTFLAQAIPFAPQVPRRDGGGGSGYFNLGVACTSGALVRVDIRRNGNLLATRSRSAHAPAIAITSPSGGEHLASALPVRWTASDADGDALSYEIQFSADAGTSWRTLSLDGTSNEFLLEHDLVPATGSAKVRVLASDGFNVAFAESPGLFRVANHPPSLLIISPTGGETVHGEASLLLEALVDDHEDEPAAGDRVLWHSNADGFLGRGLRLRLAAADLSEGEHRITASLQDMAGAIATATVQLRISRDAAPLRISRQPADQSVALGQTAAFGVEVDSPSTPGYQWQRSTDGGYQWMDLSDDDRHGGSHGPQLQVLAVETQQDGDRYRVQLQVDGQDMHSQPALLQVRADGGLPLLSLLGVELVEGQAGTRNARVTVMLDRVATQPVAFDITTVDGSAHSGSDYVAMSQPAATIAVGQSSRSFDIAVSGDSEVEPDEYLEVRVSAVSGAALAIGSARVTILSDDAPPPRLSIADAYVLEGQGGTRSLAFVARLDAPAPAGGVGFDASTATLRSNGHSATAGVDYAALSGARQSIAAGETTGVVNVKVFGDRLRETDEMLALRIGNASGATLDDDSAQGTIVNDDALGIAAVQGTGLVSPYLGQSVDVQGVVTRLVHDGFYLQSAAGDEDADPASSEGLFVLADARLRGAIAPGQRVEAHGRIREQAREPLALGRTELVAERLQALGMQPLPAPVLVDRALLQRLPGWAGLERLEGMRVSAPELTVVGPSERRDTAEGGYEIHAVPAGMPRTFLEPGRHALAVASAVDAGPVFDGNPERLRIVSGDVAGDPPLLADAGDALTGLTGVLDDGEQARVLLPDPQARIIRIAGALPRPADIPRATEATVAWLPLAAERSPATASDPSRREAMHLAKTAHVLCHYLHAPAIVAVSGPGDARGLADLAEASNGVSDDAPQGHACSRGHYYRPVGAGEHQQGFLIDARELRPGVPRVQVLSLQPLASEGVFRRADGRTIPLFARAPQLLQARIRSEQGKPLELTLLLLELEPRGKPGTEAADSGRRRQAQADHIARLLAKRHAQKPRENLLLLGGFGASEFDDGSESVMASLRASQGPAAPLRNLSLDLPASERYSTVRQGNAHAMDHALASPALLRDHRLRLDHARINADFGVDLADDPLLPLRLSDSDPLLLYIGEP